LKLRLKTVQRINEISWFLDKIKKVDKCLANLIRWRREKTQINKNKRRDITTTSNEIQRIIREYFEVNWKT
jgi:hypothetical protein